MKKLFAFGLCLSLLTVSICVQAVDTKTNGITYSPAIEFFEEFRGKIISLCARTWYKLFPDTLEPEKITDAFIPSWESVTEQPVSVTQETVMTAQTWCINEVVYQSNKTYENPFSDIELDMILIGNGRKYKIPGFWDGGNTWKIRFVCPSEGTWIFTTECSDTGNTELHGRTGLVNCAAYTGSLAVYQHGFVTVKEGKRYFTYDDGTPFLYLGDTHWSLGDETVDMVSQISTTRAEQGFTVIQSEPIGAGFDFTNGITEDDMAGLADYDEKFRLIAQAGLTHANAEFFFPAYMDSLIRNNGGYSPMTTAIKINGKQYAMHDLADTTKEYLRNICRYWVARYGAYPVLWTLGQEVDDDFYWADDNHAGWNYCNNPYKLVAEYIAQYDAYDHPLSAHQENAGSVKASNSIFRNSQEHNWFAAQWTPSKTKQSDYKTEKDYYYYAQGKPSINYEGQYCGLWTKNFGSRMQGWCAYLNGMYGYGWGGHDTWSYTNIYDEENDSSDGVDTVTSQEKKDATWLDSLAYDSAKQCGYMIRFLSDKEWYNLLPRFDDKSYFVPATNVYACCAGNADNTSVMVYFYSFTDESVAEKANTEKRGGSSTGTIGNLLPETEYKYIWFNPITGESSEEYTCVSSKLGTYYIGPRLWNGAIVDCDMVFYMYR